MRHPLPAAASLILVLTMVASSPAPAVPVAAPGYYVVPWATGIQHPTSIQWGPDGWLWVTRFEGQVLAMRDLDGVGGADTTVVFSSGLIWPLGLTHHQGSVFVTSVGTVTRYTDWNGDRVADTLVVLTDDIPWGKHWTTDIVVGPDNLLYVGVGSDSNRGLNTHPWASSVLRFHPTTGFVDVFATGFRNPYGLAFHAEGSLFGTDNGAAPDSAWNCDEAVDELNWIRPAGNFGFPWCHGDGDCADVSAQCTPAPCGAGDCQQLGGCDLSMTSPLLRLDPHGSSDGLCFGSGFTGFDGNDLFIAQFGQQESVEECFTNFGHKIVRTRLSKTGVTWNAGPVTDFVTGIARPLDVTVGPDGSLYICDFATSTIWRVFRTGGVDVPDSERPPAAASMAFALSPNPASGFVRLVWTRAPEGPVSVTILDVGGRVVTTLGTFGPEESIRWDRLDAGGRRAAPGLYFVRARAGGVTASARVILVD
ncbi:MAG: PQQ-dependent sugar dehydrogenase [Candidatus Eisenbacteria bacterium]|nr:PQQ-dependent sugar dehydrogenase [Candidatus Eisenbacteria bacterium]